MTKIRESRYTAIENKIVTLDDIHHLSKILSDENIACKKMSNVPQCLLQLVALITHLLRVKIPVSLMTNHFYPAKELFLLP